MCTTLRKQTVTLWKSASRCANDVKIYTYMLSPHVQVTLSDASGAKQRAEDAATCTSATLNSLKKKAHAYKKENRTLLTNYDDWLKTLVSQRGSIGAGYSSDVSQS